MLGAAYVEYIHDELVSKLWPGSDPVIAGEYRSKDLLESATGRPFHSAFGEDAYPTVIEKAVALFHSLIANHPFHNGNKRTAVLALDHFLLANGYFLILSNHTMFELAARTAAYRERGLSHEKSIMEIHERLQKRIIPLRFLRTKLNMRLYRESTRMRLRIRRHRFTQLLPAN